jgi:hypothetical protein
MGSAIGFAVFGGGRSLQPPTLTRLLQDSCMTLERPLNQRWLKLFVAECCFLLRTENFSPNLGMIRTVLWNVIYPI